MKNEKLKKQSTRDKIVGKISRGARLILNIFQKIEFVDIDLNF